MKRDVPKLDPSFWNSRTNPSDFGTFKNQSKYVYLNLTVLM
jgi:hypothetical protein